MEKYWISMFVLFLVFLAGGWWFVSMEQEKMLQSAMKSEKEKIAEYVRGKAVAHLNKEIFLNESYEERDKVFSKFWSTIQSPEYIRVKVWNSNYTLIWADLKESIGQRFPDNHEMQEALEGEIELELESLDGAENETERQFFQTAEVYVPIFGAEGKEVIGVIEVYKTAHFINDVKENKLQLMLISGVVLLSVYGVFAILLFRYFKRREQM